jgi:hypothetical protein
MKRKPKIDHLLDEVFAFYIKCRDKWMCQICFTGFNPVEGGTYLLDCSHFLARKYMSTRYNEQNCDAVCRWCHKKLEHEKTIVGEYSQWKQKQLGESKFEELYVLARGVLRLRKHGKIDLTQKFIEKIEKLQYDTEVFKKKLLAFQ